MRTVTGGPGRHILLALIAALSLGVSLGCSTASKNKEAAAKGVVATDEQIFIGDTVEKNYDPNVIMKRAESFFDKEEYAEAIIEYQHFLDLHRVHTLAPYAQFRLSESHFKMAKTIDRDMEPVRKALENYEKLLKDYPDNKWQNEAKERIHACNDLIAQAAYFVGKFYQRREAYLAAAKRFETIVKRYPEMDVASDALYDLASTYHEIGADDWAQERLIALDQQYPNHKHKVESQKLYAALKVMTPTTAIAMAPPPPPSGTPTLAASNVPVALAAVEPAPSPLPPTTLVASAATSPSLTNETLSQTFSDGLHRPPPAPAPSRPPTQPAMTLAAATVPAPAAEVVTPSAPRRPVQSHATMRAESEAAPAEKMCRVGAWC